jgi:hypothetical protein
LEGLIVRIRSATIVAVVAWVVGCGSATTLEPQPSLQITSFTIQPPVAASVRDLDELEQREQIRDWAVIGTVARLGATPKQAAAATYQLAAAALAQVPQAPKRAVGCAR